MAHEYVTTTRTLCSFLCICRNRNTLNVRNSMEVLDQETKILDFGFHLSIIRSMHCRRKDFGSRDPKGVK